MYSSELVNRMLPFAHLKKEYSYYDMSNCEYEEVDSANLEYMSLISYENPDKMCVFPILMKDEEGNYFADIYFFGYFDGEMGYRRFVIERDCRFVENDEQLFIQLCHDEELFVLEKDFYLFLRCVREFFPEIHYFQYCPGEIGMALEAFYFSNHHCMMEILYKASLPYLAYNIFELDGVNYMEESPNNIIAGLPLRMIRIFNNPWLVKKIFTAEDQEKMLKVYQMVSGYFKKNEYPNEVQWEYFERLYDGRYKGFESRIYNELGDEDDFQALNDYDLYLEVLESFNYREYFPVDGTGLRHSILERLGYILCVKSIIRMEETVNQGLKENWQGDLEYENEEYFIYQPKSLIELTREASYQRNCLLNYIISASMGETNILFCREKKRPEKSLITMEIKDGKIKQAWGFANRAASRREKEFLITYARAKGLQY